MTERSLWKTRLGFILASAGSAVGLGAIWKFPYMAGTNGGSVFMLPYVFFSVTIGLALLIGEMCMGRGARKGAMGAYKVLGGGRARIFGPISVLTGFLVLAFYSVVGGWTVYYFFQALIGNGVIDDPAQMKAVFGAFASSGAAPVAAHLVFLASTALVVYFGVQNGIERVSKVLMPLLFVMMIVLIVRGLTLPGAMEGVKFLFKPDMSAFSGESLLNAMGFAFFSLSVGSASQMNYGSYLSDRVHLPSSVSWIVFLAIMSAVLGGLMIMPAVFAFGLTPDAGPGLTFATMPAVFSKLPFGHAFSIAFYACLFVAALTSSISIFEMSVQCLCDEWHFTRPRAVALAGIVLAVLGTLCALGFGPLADVRIFGRTFFDFFDYLTSNIGMPLGVIGISLVSAWLAWPVTRRQLCLVKPMSEAWLKGYRIIAGIFAPVLIVVVMLKGLGLF